jgi:hypothetical protein
MDNAQLDVLESADETSVYRGDRMLATFYGADADPTGYANALFFASRYSQGRNLSAPDQPPEAAPDSPVKANAQAPTAQLSLID